MMEALNPLLQTLAAKHEWLPAALAWIGGLRVAFKFGSGRLQLALTEWLTRAAADNDAAEDKDIEGLLGSRWYRAVAFALDLLCSVKLPSKGYFLAMLDHASSQAEVMDKVKRAEVPPK